MDPLKACADVWRVLVCRLLTHVVWFTHVLALLWCCLCDGHVYDATFQNNAFGKCRARGGELPIVEGLARVIFTNVILVPSTQ